MMTLSDSLFIDHTGLYPMSRANPPSRRRPYPAVTRLKPKPNKPCLVLAHNRDPVDELPPMPCQIIKGKMPSVLHGGAYIRDGPNPQYHLQGNHHLFEGDGMLHCLLFPNDNSDNPIFCSRFVQTNRLQMEKKAGRQILPTFFSDLCGPKPLSHLSRVILDMITGKIDISRGIGQANAGLFFFGGKLFAMDESDLPYVVQLSSSGEMTTIGRWNFDGKLSTCMTAHPKKDPVTKEVFAMRYSFLPPYLTYFWFNAKGEKQKDVPIFSLKRLSFIHDFAITERYSIFCDNGCCIQPLKMALFRAPLVKADGRDVPRIGIIPRYSESEKDMQWFDTPGLTPVHSLNAWEEEDGSVVKIIVSNVSPIEKVLDSIDTVQIQVEMVTLDLRNKSMSRSVVSSQKLEFGVINPRYVGRRLRYGYFCLIGAGSRYCGVVKLDFEKKGEIVASRMFGDGISGSEALFVPALEEGDGEDDGYLLSYVHDESTGKSSFLVMDARSPDLEVVAEAALPGRVPYGFHGIFLSKEEVQEHRAEKY